MTAGTLFVDFTLLRGQTTTVPGLHEALIGEILLYAVMVLFQGYVAVVFFQCKRAAPTLVIALLLAGVVVNIIDSLMVQWLVHERPDATGIVRGAVVAAIWIPYFVLSRRVKATFTN